MKRFLIALAIICCFLTCKKAPEEVAVTSVSLSQPTAEMVIGETISLSATVLPSNATDKSVTWASSNRSVATVAGGKVTAVAEGSSTITASSGGKSASCSITVKKKTVDVTSVELNKTELALVEGESETLVATVKPDDATDKTVTWSTSDATIATVENGKVTAIKEGTTNIAAKAGGKSATCKVSISKKVIPVESVELNKSSLMLVKGETEVLIATVKPDNATDKTVKWSSSDATIATVTDGKVAAVMEGKATITAKADGKEAVCNVTVTAKIVAVESIELDKTTLELTEGDTDTLVATVKPDDATDKTVTWSSSDTTVATVSEGKVTALKVGPVIITAKAGEKTATCSVTVNAKTVPVESVKLDKENLEMVEGDKATLVVTVLPEDATDKTVAWTSSNEAIASVVNGEVTAIKDGEVIISAKAGEKSATCMVKVSKKVVAVTEVTLNKTSLEMKENEEFTLSATVIPDDATDKTVTWSTSDGSIATVADGKVTAVKEGTAIITVKAGGKTATCTVTVICVERSVQEIRALPDDAFVSTVEMLVIAMAKIGYIISDGTASIYVQSAPGSLKIGDKVKIRAAKNTCGGVAQLYSVQQIDILSSNNPVSYPDPVNITNNASINTATTTFSQVSYVKMAGQLIQASEDNNGLTYDLRFDNIPIEQHYAHLQYPYDYQKSSDFYKGLAACIDKGISLEFTGFFFGIQESDGALYFVPTSLKKVVPEGCVDLGLSVFWSDHNVGAGAWWGVGGYYAWGEIKEKDYYGWNYKFAPSGSIPFTKYNTFPSWGDVDNKTRLDLEDDVAHYIYGGEWRMPTEQELQELIDNCTCEYIDDIGFNEQSGVKFTSRVVGYTDNFIFFPFSGAKADSDLVGFNEWFGLNSSEINPEYPFSSIFLYVRKKTSYPYYELKIERYDDGMGRLAGLSTRGVRSR